LNESNKSKFGSVLKRVLAIFINHYPRELTALQVVGLSRKWPLKYNSVRTAINRLYNLGFLVRTARGKYMLKDKEAAIKFLDGTRSKRLIHLRSRPKVDESINIFGYEVITDRGPGDNRFRGWFEQFLDLGSVCFEVGRVQFRVKKSISDRLRVGFEVNSNDKARQVVVRLRGLTVIISKYGCVRLYLRDPASWFGDFVGFLRGQGLRENEVLYVLRQLVNMLPKAKASCEIPVVHDGLRLFKDLKIETRVGDKVLVSRICSSHLPLEVETSGDLDLVCNFLSALAAVQHFSVLEFVQASELHEIKTSFNTLAKSFEELAKALKQLGQKKIEYEVPKPPPKEGPGYVT